jgi:hypothetical protein
MPDSAKNNNVLQDRWPEKKEQELSLRTDVEKIILFFRGDLPNAKMTPALEEKINRMKETSTLITKYGGAKKVIPILEHKFDISFSAARRLFMETQDAYGDITHFNRQYHIDTYLNMVVQGANQARDAGDFRSYQGLLKEYKEAIKDFMGTSDADLYRKIIVPPFQIGFFPEILKTKIPANWKSRLEKLKEAKRKDEIEDAIVILDSQHDEEDSL